MVKDTITMSAKPSPSEIKINVGDIASIIVNLFSSETLNPVLKELFNTTQEIIPLEKRKWFMPVILNVILTFNIVLAQ